MMSKSYNDIGKDRFSMRVLKVLGGDSSIFVMHVYIPKVTPLKNSTHLGFSMGDLC